MRFQLLVWPEIWSHLFDLAIAFALALPIRLGQGKQVSQCGSPDVPAGGGFLLRLCADR